MDIFKDTLILLITSFIKEEKQLDIEPKEAGKLIKLPPDNSFGDYSVAAYYLAKHGFKDKPDDLAVEFLNYARFNFEKISDFFGDVEIKGPYINFFVLKEKFISIMIKNVLRHGDDYGREYIKETKRVVIDFSSPNIAKPFGVGHLRSTVIGMSLSNIYEFCGYDVLRINYLGDFGTQFGKLITAFCRFDDINFSEFEREPIKVLYKLYVRIHKEIQDNGVLEEDSKLRFKGLEDNMLKTKRDLKKQLEDLQNGENSSDKENIWLDIKLTPENKSYFCDSSAGQYDLWKLFRGLSVEEFKRIYDLMGIKFDAYEGESQSAEFANEVVELLHKGGLAVESEGALIIPLKDIKTPALIAKSDGTSLYLSRDIVTAVLRMAKYRYDKMIYVVGAEQSLHFNQLFGIFDMLKEEQNVFADNPVFQKNAVSVSGRLMHVKFGRIIGMSTRKGNLVFLEDYVEEAKIKAFEKLSERESLSNNCGTKEDFNNYGDENLEKTLKFDEKSAAALKIGIGAVIFNDLKTRRNMDVNFNWDNILSFEGQTGPYLQYTVSRINSLIAKLIKEKDSGLTDAILDYAKTNKKSAANLDKPFLIFKSDEDFNELFLLAKQISIFKSNITDALNLNEPSIISSYVLELAALFNKYYQNYRLMGNSSDYIEPRIWLLIAVRIVLINALKLICIPVLERM